MQQIATDKRSNKRQLQILLLVFAAVFAALGAGYYLFLRTDYTVLYTGLRPADASAIVTELDAKGVTYKLQDKGSTILVAEDEADSVRLAVVGSDAPLKGSVGFELFNKSDMGLTDFAQKINYQRALQGELSRTIMMMDGIEDARVHLSIPDRSPFRGGRSEPKAAVTISVQRGRVVDGARVAGIQRLVAAAVPDLALSSVVILDSVGRVISQSAAPDMAAAPMQEREAVQEYYRARIRTAVEAVLPELKFDVRVLVLPFVDAGGQWGEAAAPGAQPRTGAPARDFRLSVSLVTLAPLGPEEQNVVRNAAAGAIGLKPEAGDAFAFAVGPLTPVAAPPTPGTAVSVGTVVHDTAPATPGRPAWSSLWLILFVALVGVALLLLARRTRGTGLTMIERDAFVERIRHQLAPPKEIEDARA
ncbi:MAG TPA: flagellar basal-body MS-ring/collar protein FliF [Allosphingosinicella sp.]|jgi:flagellar M-ring protein FliF